MKSPTRSALEKIAEILIAVNERISVILKPDDAQIFRKHLLELLDRIEKID